jgi:hypothetical protein
MGPSPTMASIDVIDLSLIARWRPNVLLLGPPDANDAALDQLAALCREPVHPLNPANRMPWPDRGTVVLRQVTDLDVDEQQAVYEWLTERNPCVQVVSTAGPSIYAAVAAGTFLPDLFYRLNVVTVET